jgi:homoaconitate hydratase
MTWWRVPPVVKVELTGSLAAGVTSKDIILALCGAFNKGEVLNHAVEFAGTGITALTIDDRLTIANMTTEWGALVRLMALNFDGLECFANFVSPCLILIYKRLVYFHPTRSR